ncbi:MAG: IS21 family transposase [Chloroflexota bacterium]
MEIHELHAQGHSIREIARRTGLARNTIAKALRQRDFVRYKPRPQVTSKLDPFKPYILQQIALGVTNCERLLREIRLQGYDGGHSILRDFVQPLRPPKRPLATVRFETKPGEQAQVDFGVFVYDEEGRRSRYHAFIMVLSYSRMTYVEFVERQDLSTLIRCHVHAFETLGIAETILYDNLKPVVLGRDEAGRVILNPRFADFALTIGFRPRVCRPYRAQTKGRVERTVGYLRQNFWPGRTFASLTDLNEQVRLWCNCVANCRKHGTTYRRPCDLWADEPLQQMPPRSVVAPFLTEERRVGRDGYVQFAGSRYGVPCHYAGQLVEVREMEMRLEILANGHVIAVHPRALYPKSTLTLPGQWDGLAAASQRPAEDKLAFQIASPEVQVRPLAAYETAAGGGGE